MYYRYEIRFSDTEPWAGICTALNPSERRKMSQWLHEPKWYKNNPDIDSEAWFTEYGFNHYKPHMEELISEMGNWRSLPTMLTMQIRIRKADTLEDIVVKGKTQCIRLLTKQKASA